MMAVAEFAVQGFIRAEEEGTFQTALRESLLLGLEDIFTRSQQAFNRIDRSLDQLCASGVKPVAVRFAESDVLKDIAKGGAR